MSTAKAVLNDSMTVQELINHLQGCDPEAKVVFHYNYGDYGHTEVADVVSDVEMIQVRYSDYHRMLTVVENNDVFNDDEADLVDAVVIGSSVCNLS